MRLAVIVNPFSGRGRRTPRGESRVGQARELARRAGVEAEIRVTKGPGHATELAATFAESGFPVVAAWGGDGTINEVAGPLMRSETALAVIPAGSGDGLARGLGLPLDAAGAFTAAVSGLSARIDVGFLGDRHFLNIGGIGFDAAVASAFDRSGRHGVLSYAAAAFASLRTYRCRDYGATLQGEPMAGRRFLITFANGRQYGNGLVIAPDADPRDGRLNAVVVSDGSAARQLWRARRLFVHQLEEAEGVRRTLVSTATIAGDSLQCHVDGEPFDSAGTLEVRIEPGALRIAGLASPEPRTVNREPVSISVPESHRPAGRTR